MLHRKVKEGETVRGRRGDDSFALRLGRIGRGWAIVDIEASGFELSFEAADELDDIASDLTSIPRSD